MAKSNTRQTADVAQVVGRKNLIINGGFEVSQRGDYTSATTITDLSFMLDRWKMAKQGTGTSATLQDLGGSIRMEATASSTGTFRAYQKLEDKGLYKRLSNQTVTMSAWVKSNTSNARIQAWIGAWVGFDQPHSGNGQWEKLTATYTFGDLTSLPDGNLNLQVGIDGFNSAHVSISTGDYVEAKDVQLEFGSVATEFEHRSYGEELALCQRYFLKSAMYAQGYQAGNNDYSVMVHFPVEMRAVPTMTILSTPILTNVTSGPVFSGMPTNPADAVRVQRIQARRTTTGYLEWGSTFTADAEL